MVAIDVADADGVEAQVLARGVVDVIVRSFAPVAPEKSSILPASVAPSLFR